MKEELEQLRQYEKTLEATKSQLSIDLNTEIHKVDVGSIVTLESACGKLKAGEDLMVSKVDDTVWDYRQPWLTVRYKTKSGEWSKDEVRVYGNWRLKDE